MGKQVLLAEDEVNIVTSITFLLEQEGFEVASINDGAAVLSEIERIKPDVLILDVMLPNKDGYEILKEIKAGGGHGSLAVLMLTAKGQKEDRDTALSLGADRFMTKPYANAEIVATVRELAGD